MQRQTAAILLACVAFTGCALQRAQLAESARVKMVGMSKEHVLACMGPPQQRQAEGQTEVWSYASGDCATFYSGTTTASTNVSMSGAGPWMTGTANTTGNSFGSSSKRWCTVNVVMENGLVQRVNYAGPTGGIVTEGEQCAFAVKNCLQQ